MGENPNAVMKSRTTFDDPLRWSKPLRIFACSWSDWFIKMLILGVRRRGTSLGRPLITPIKF